jgi:hypothetical protein
MNPLNLLGDLLTNHRPNFPIGTYEQATQRAARGRNVSVDRVVSLTPCCPLPGICLRKKVKRLEKRGER